MPGLFEDAEVLSFYGRQQAIEDGTLVDISAKARKVFGGLPVAMTRTAWADTVEWPEDDMQAMQDEEGRLHDVLWMAFLAVRRNRDTSRFTYELYRIPRDGHSTAATPVRLECVLSGDDAGDPVVTIQFPGED